MPPPRHALLIGVNRYPLVAGADLRGCLNDVELMASLLRDRFAFPPDNVTVLRDAQASQAGIRAGVDELLARLETGGVAVIFFAGHGSRRRDPTAPSLFRESIVPADSGRGEHPNRDVDDREIDLWAQRLNAVTPHVTLIFDCCHSGAVTRDPFGEAVREIAPDLRRVDGVPGASPADPSPFSALATVGAPRPPLQAFAPPPAPARPSGWLSGSPAAGSHSAVLLAACRAEERACEHRLFTGGRVLRHGALTYFLGRALARAPEGATWRDVFETLAPELTAVHGRQHPQLEGRADDVLFDCREQAPAAYLALCAVDEAGVELAGGAAHGVTPGSTWAVYAQGTHRPGPPGSELATVEVEAVDAATCRGRVAPATGGSDATLAVGQRAFLRRLALAEPALRAAVDPTAADPELLSRLAGSTLAVAVEDPDAADLLIRRLPARGTVAAGDPCPGVGALSAPAWAVVGRDGRLAVRLLSEGSRAPAELFAELVAELETLARYRHLLALDNPDPASALRGRVRLELARRGPAGELVPAAAAAGDGLVTFREGERAEIEIRSGHDAPLWVSLVELGTDAKVQLLLPKVGHPTYRPGGAELAPGGTLSVGDYYRCDHRFAAGVAGGLPLHLPPGFPWAAEPGEEVASGVLTLKLLVTAAPADFSFLEQVACRDPGPGSHPLVQLALDAVGCHTVGWGTLGSDAVGWGTRSVSLPSADGAGARDWAVVTRPVKVRRAVATGGER